MCSKQIGLFGGAFDPITTSHESIIVKLLDSDILDEIWLMPCYESAYGKKMISFDKRLKMCQMVANKYKNIKVSDFELYNNYNGQTYDTLLKFFDDYANEENQFYFITGMDNANKIHTWDNYKKIIKMIPFIIIPRGDVDEQIRWYKQSPHIFLDCEKDDGSSTKVREDIKNSVKSKLLDKDIYDYISSNDLYNKN